MHHGLADARASLLAVTRAAVAAGLLPGTAGNLSLRDAASELIVITPSQIPYATLTPDSMVVIDLDGAVVEGQHPPSSEWRLHVALYRARPDAGAIVHTHSPYATALAILDEGLPFVLAEMSLIGGAVPCAPYALPGSAALGAGAAAALGAGSVLLLAHHGAVALGPDPTTALNRAVILEDAARAYHLARQIGHPRALSPEEQPI